MIRTRRNVVRPPAVAGRFYSDNPADLRADIRRYVEGAGTPLARPPKAVIAPHAGLRYSGRTAGHAYAALASHRGTVERVVVVGPAHRVPVDGVGTSSAGAWATPLGPLEIDGKALDSLANLPGVGEADDAHAPEHSVEVQLPFIREVLGPVPIVPLIVGRSSDLQVAGVIDRLWGDDRTVIVASSDLSHHLDLDTAHRRDTETATAILEGRVQDVGPGEACGCLPIGGLVLAARARGLPAELLHLSTSADEGGDRSRVVGYGSFAFRPPRTLTIEERAWLLEIAARAIESRPDDGESLDGAVRGTVPAGVHRPGASFVTLSHNGTLLGCIGSLEPRRPLWRDVARNARAAAFDDPRFPALRHMNPDDLHIEIAILSPLAEVPDPSPERLKSLLRPAVDGLVLAAGGRRATFLPRVWNQIPDVSDFVDELARKASWGGPWVPGARAWRYTTHEIAR